MKTKKPQKRWTCPKCNKNLGNSAKYHHRKLENCEELLHNVTENMKEYKRQYFYKNREKINKQQLKYYYQRKNKKNTENTENNTKNNTELINFLIKV